MVDQTGAYAYNSWWQFRADSWSRLEEATGRIASSLRRGKPIDQDMTDAVHAACAALAPLEQFWAFPGHAAFGVVQELAATGAWGRLARLVARINRALVTESYRMGSLGDIARVEHRDDSVDLIVSTSHHDPLSRPYFEVLVIEGMSPAQEQRLREEVHSWRRPGDRFIYDLVVVGSGVEAAMAMRLNANIQACVIRRRFAHAALRDLTNLADFADATLADDLADHSPDERAQILAPRLAQIRPEVDLYLMTDIAVEEVAGRVSHHFRRVFHAREGALELHLTILAGVADRYSTPFFEALRAYSQRPTGVFHALPISQGKSIVNSHWIRDMVSFLVSIARDLDLHASEMNLAERAVFERAVMHLTNPVAPLPHFSGFHPAFLSESEPPTPEGDVRKAFFLSYDHTMCEYLLADEVEERMESGESVVSATFVTPYPPGFPVLVPGQVFSDEILSFMRSLDTPEIHGYQPGIGYRVYTSKALEMVAERPSG